MSRPMVTLDARAYFTRGGIGRYTRNLTRGLLARPGELGYRVLISNLHEPTEVPAAAGVVVRQSSAAWMDEREEDARLPAETEGARLFHSFTGAWVAQHVASVATVHDLTPAILPSLMSETIQRHFDRIRRALPRCAAVIAVSRSTASDLTRMLALRPDRIHVVPGAADPLFRPRPPDRRVLRMFGVEPDSFLLNVGVLAPHKNLVRLAEAYRDSGARHPLLVAGAEAWEGETIRRIVGRLGLGDRVRFIGRVDDETLAQLYSSCRVFLYPSLYEGFGLPVLEAMACGAAVVCSSTSALPEVAGHAAELVPPECVDRLADAIGRLDEDRGYRTALRARGLDRARSFSWAQTARLTAAVHDIVLREAA